MDNSLVSQCNLRQQKRRRGSERSGDREVDAAGGRRIESAAAAARCKNCKWSGEERSVLPGISLRALAFTDAHSVRATN